MQGRPYCCECNICVSWSPLTLSADWECFTGKKGLQNRMRCVFVNYISITVPPLTASNGLWQNTADIDRETDADSLNCSLMTRGGSKSTYHPQSTTGGAVPCAIYCVNTAVIYIPAVPLLILLERSINLLLILLLLRMLICEDLTKEIIGWFSSARMCKFSHNMWNPS